MSKKKKTSQPANNFKPYIIPDSNKKAFREGQFRPKHATTEAVRDRLQLTDMKKLHRDPFKSVSTAKNIANLRHKRVFVLLHENMHWLLDQGQVIAYERQYGIQKDNIMTVKPEWEEVKDSNK